MSQILFFLFSLTVTTSQILEITDKNFHRQTTIHSNCLLMFYNPKCLHCDRAMREFEKASNLLSSDYPRTALGRVDCETIGKTLCIDSKITRIPTFKLYYKSEFIKDYHYSRNSWNFVKFMRAQVNPPSREITSIEDFRLFLLEQKDATFVGFFTEGARMKKPFFRIAQEWGEIYVFAHSYCENLLRRQRVYDGIVLFRPVRFQNPYEEERELYEGRPISGEIKTFILTNYHGLVGLRTPFNRNDFADPLAVLYYSATPKTQFKEPHYWRSRLLRVAKKHSHMSFAVSDKMDFVQELASFGVNAEENTKPVVVAWSLEGKKYKMEEEFSSEALKRFVDDLLEGLLTPFRRYESIPKNQDGYVKIVEERNFDLLVMKNGKDTLIEFFSPLCIYCQNFNPIYKELAEKLKDEDVVLVKMDATINEVPDLFHVEVFPTIYWLGVNNKNEPIMYTGKRTMEDLFKFVAKKATTELKNYDRRGVAKEYKYKIEL